MSLRIYEILTHQDVFTFVLHAAYPKEERGQKSLKYLSGVNVAKGLLYK